MGLVTASRKAVQSSWLRGCVVIAGHESYFRYDILVLEPGVYLDEGLEDKVSNN